jgi:hypothetical protein
MGFSAPALPPPPEPPPAPPALRAGGTEAQAFMNRRLQTLAATRGGTLSGSPRGVASDANVLTQSLGLGSGSPSV